MDRIPVWLRRSLGIGIGLGVTAFAGFLAFHGIDWHALLTSIEEASLLYLFLGTLFHFLAYFCMGRRWRTELHGSSELSNTDAIASVSGSIFLNNYFPLRIGDVIRCGLMARKLERSRIGILSVLLVERLVDLAVVLCFAMVTFPLLLAGSNADLGYLYGVVGFTAITIAGLVLVHNPHTRDLILGIAQGILPNLLSGPVCGLINRVADGLQNFRSPSVVIRIAFWTICIWLCILLGNYMWILAF
ncbi:MAG: flippase-like domain-containing protein, partial [Leptospiraceae bacterium]|nr:flippase-like domain-containing protein [Leptospiraceae bacterium]